MKGLTTGHLEESSGKLLENVGCFVTIDSEAWEAFLKVSWVTYSSDYQTSCPQDLFVNLKQQQQKWVKIVTLFYIFEISLISDLKQLKFQIHFCNQSYL